jgi:hypothetical protein
MDVAALRASLHQAVDELIDRHLTDRASPPDDLQVTRAASPANFKSYRWPDSRLEDYQAVTAYLAAGPSGDADVLVARTVRPAWNREDRGRVVVFGKPPGAPDSTYYPWVEWTETDDGEFAAPLTDPASPRRTLREGDPLPPHLTDAEIRRNDELFTSIQDGPALRVVVGDGDHMAMIRHGYHVAGMRGRLSPGRRPRRR